MAKKNTKVNAQAVETIEEAKEANMVENTVIENVEAIEEVAGPKDMLLLTASRGKNTKLTWFVVTVNELDPTVKVKGCAIELPVQVAERIGTDKFVSYIELDTIRRCVEEQTAVRGTASTVSDVYNRYCKVTDTKGERIATALAVFNEILEAFDGGAETGAWERPEPEKPEVPEAEEAGTEEPEVENPDEVEAF